MRACRQAGRPGRAARRQSPVYHPHLCLPVKKRCVATMHNGIGSAEEICPRFRKKKGCRKAGCAWQEPEAAGGRRRAARRGGCGPPGPPAPGGPPAVARGPGRSATN